MTDLDDAAKRLRDDLTFTEHEDDIRTVLDALAAAQADSRTGQDMHQYWQARAERAEAKIAAALAIPSSGIGPDSTEDEIAQGEGWNDALREVRRILTGEKES